MPEAKLGRIFVVEDNELNLKLFCDVLLANGYEVQATRNGVEAAELIRKFMPGLILMDVQLQGVSGLDIVKQIKEDKYIGDIPIIAVTAFAMKDDKERIVATGCEGYMAKPISIEPFMEMVAKFIKK